MAPLTRLLILWGLLHQILCICYAKDPDFSCTRANSSRNLSNFTSEFVMLQHQLRGVLTVIDECSFRVSQFDMLPGTDVHWWGSQGDDLKNLTSGFMISDSPLNTTFKNNSFIVRLKDNITWDRINLVSVWDVPTASDFGHIFLSSSNSLQPNPVPTMFDNCKVLSENYRVRWSLTEDEIEIGLEAAVGIQNYMAFGWANPNTSGSLMVGGDVVVAGFKEENGIPFADDYYITKYSECMFEDDGKKSPSGVCPDFTYESGKDSPEFVNNTKLIYGHRKDGVLLVRYSRPLKSNDTKYDVVVDPKSEMRVIWAIGLIKPPDAFRPFYLPQNHGGTFGYLRLNISERVNDCVGPLDAQDKEDQELVIADRKEPLVVSTGPALHYPNPPNPSKVLYINRKEAPLLRVERGVPVKFSIQAGHDVALYITSDPLGGNATLSNNNTSAVTYFGGPEAQGVQASPTELVWSPDRNTPDLVYYQSLYMPKMGWKVQVVDGGLPDMYNNSVSLDDQQVLFFWTLSDNSISIAVRGEKKSGYVAIGFGRSMVNSFAYVGWIDETGRGKVGTYYIDGRDTSNVGPTNENLTYVRCRSENGVITFEFTRPLNPSCNERPECNNIIDPSTPLKVVWAMGTQWTDGARLTVRNMHYATSTRPMSVLLMRGSAEAEEDLRPVLAVHGFMMFLAWGILLPGGILAARYLKHVKGDSWFRIHVYLQYSGLAIVFLGFLFAVAELQGFTFASVHVKFGMLGIFLLVLQPANAYFRPKKPNNPEELPSSKRIAWEYTHQITGRCAIVIGIASLITGMRHLGERYGDENVHGLTWALVVWFLTGLLGVGYLEYKEMKQRRGPSGGRSSWVLGNSEDEDDVDLLDASRVTIDKESTNPAERMEIQLEPLR